MTTPPKIHTGTLIIRFWVEENPKKLKLRGSIHMIPKNSTFNFQSPRDLNLTISNVLNDFIKDVNLKITEI